MSTAKTMTREERLAAIEHAPLIAAEIYEKCGLTVPSGDVGLSDEELKELAYRDGMWPYH